MDGDWLIGLVERRRLCLLRNWRLGASNGTASEAQMMVVFWRYRIS